MKIKEIDIRNYVINNHDEYLKYCKDRGLDENNYLSAKDFYIEIKLKLK